MSYRMTDVNTWLSEPYQVSSTSVLQFRKISLLPENPQRYWSVKPSRRTVASIITSAFRARPMERACIPTADCPVGNAVLVLGGLIGLSRVGSCAAGNAVGFS